MKISAGAVNPSSSSIPARSLSSFSSVKMPEILATAWLTRPLLARFLRDSSINKRPVVFWYSVICWQISSKEISLEINSSSFSIINCISPPVESESITKTLRSGYWVSYSLAARHAELKLPERFEEIVMQKIEEEMAFEVASYIKEEEEKAKYEATRKSQSILANAIQQYANETIQEKTVSVVSLPNDEMKGRIIGREGRNIRAIEAVTGVDLIVDDTPDSVVISCFDPIRREIARRTLEILVSDGRIQPPRIEEVYSKCQKELENEIREEGEKAVFETGVGKIHPELVKLIGRLRFRTSYGQNALSHSKEVAFLAGKLAAEIGENEMLARRAGLLHDIGKASDHEMEGSHVEIGMEFATKFRENETVINAIASHHGDHEPTTIIGHLVAAADTLSAARPGARSESIDNYIKRLQALEDLTNEFKGVEKTYALQAGREVRVLVKPEEISDEASAKLARDIKKKIETTMDYPGTIKVTVIREVRVQEVAR